MGFAVGICAAPPLPDPGSPGKGDEGLAEAHLSEDATLPFCAAILVLFAAGM